MTDRFALTGATVFDGYLSHENRALLVDGKTCVGIVDQDDIPPGFAARHLHGGLLVPGFIDLQVNGGGGILLNETPTADSIKTICDAHARFGTTALLPTLITDSATVFARACEAALEANLIELPGFLGLHLEGPHLCRQKKGAHCAGFIREMSNDDVDILIKLRRGLPNLLITVAPESVSDEQIAILSAAGIIVSLGHSDAQCQTAKSAFAAGASCATHLFNAMSGLSHREPGLVGAVLNAPDVFAGLIADGHHVSPDAIDIALKCKTGDGKLFLVTDAMATIGTELDRFELNGRTILRKDGRLTLEDGTLAGADLDMISAVRFMVRETAVNLFEALRMASLYPARCLGVDDKRGRLAAGTVADIVHLGENNRILSVWRQGQKC